VKKVHYFSDSTVAQYRNRFAFVNLYFHQEEFYIVAEWNFFETAHGKSPCDAIGGCVKTGAMKASLQKILIRSPMEFYEWAKNKWQEEGDKKPKINIRYVSEEDVTNAFKTVLEKKFQKAVAVPDTFQIHQVVPLSNSKVRVRLYSNAKEFKDHVVLKK